MSLSSVFHIAQNSLSLMTKRTAVLSRNVNDAVNPDYARRELSTVTSVFGSQTLSIRRAADAELERATLAALTANSGQALLAQNLAAINGLMAGEDPATQLQDRLTALHNSLQTLSTTPSSTALAQSTLSHAASLADTIRTGAENVQSLRTEFDAEIGRLLGDLGTLLADFKIANDEVVQGAKIGRDTNDAADMRTSLLKQISEIVPVSIVTRPGNDLVLITASGATLFEVNARNISFEPTAPLTASTVGNPVIIDHAKFGASNKGLAEVSGKLEALLKLRDSILPGMQRQLDEFAHGLIANFAETDASGILAPMQGLFTWSGGPAIPSEGILTAGMAQSISINALYDPNAGGSLSRLRDGGANGAQYDANPSGAASFADRLISFLDGLDGARQFSPLTGLASESSIVQFAGEMGGWFADIRSNAENSARMAETRHSRFSEQLSNITGVNIDDEMILLGQLEHSYEASARLLKVADQMLQDLLAAVN